MMPSRSFFIKFKWEFAFVAFLLLLSECFCSVDAQQMENNTVTTNITTSSRTTTTPKLTTNNLSASSKTTKAPAFVDEHRMQIIIIGGVIAAIVLLIVVVLIVRCCCCKKRKRRHSHTSDDDNHNDQPEEEEHGKNKLPKPSAHTSTISAVPSDYKTDKRLGATDADVEAEVVPKTKPVPKKPKSKQIKHKLASFFGTSSSTTKRPSAAEHGVEVPETIRDDED
ncbi:hypothetical protein niasHS_000996 [Heterodera schachtii]|uniref:Uncharacterized protein n=1 Tax=Heterodera schachtii TaxID=97005 RepID=A0ABD2K8H7_HETSC